MKKIEVRLEDCVHTLIAVFTDERVSGALHVLLPLYAGENPLEPERVSEKLHFHKFWILGN